MTGEKAQIANILRGWAVFLVVMHHWLQYIPSENTISTSHELKNLILTIAGTGVHLFFILSGYGLTLSYFRSPSFSWRGWVKRRFVKILFPYLITVALLFVFVNFLHTVFPQTFHASFSWKTLVSYLTLTRNFYSPSWEFNPTFWYMPVIIGLYCLFPFMILLLKKAGPAGFLVTCGFVTYFSISAFLLAGYLFIGHQNSLPFFYLIEFAAGMYVGWVSKEDDRYLEGLAKVSIYCVGICLYFSSWMLIRSWELGNIYNDLLTALGIFFIALYPSSLILRAGGVRVCNVVEKISERSYYIYLIHGSLILFLVIPILKRINYTPLRLTVVIITGILFFITLNYFVGVIGKLLAQIHKWLINGMEGAGRIDHQSTAIRKG